MNFHKTKSTLKIRIKTKNFNDRSTMLKEKTTGEFMETVLATTIQTGTTV